MMVGPCNDKCSRPVVCNDDPPPLSITPKELWDLPEKGKRWKTDYPPVDILLLTVEDCELLACYHYLRDSFKSYEKSIGYVYFGKMGDDEDESLKVALLRCPKESLDPEGSKTTVKNAVTLLRPKVTFLVGFCYSLNDKAQLGDVVISPKLTTDHYETPVSRDVDNLVRSAAEGWKAPLENPEAQKVKVHRNEEILSCSELINDEQQCQCQLLHPGAIAVEMEGKGENYSQGYSCLAFVIIVQKIVLP